VTKAKHRQAGERRTVRALGVLYRSTLRGRCAMSITTIQILQAMVSEDGYIGVLRGPTYRYKEHISVCRADGQAMRSALVFSRAILNDLVKANFVRQDGLENAQQITIFRLTDEGRRRVAELSLSPSRLSSSLKSKLLSLGYPWPENLEGKSIAWLKREIEAIKVVDGGTDQEP
jgi:hypothetical protein